MERKTRFTKKLISTFWSIMMSLPLLLIVILFITATFRNDSITLSYNTIDTYLTSIASNSTITQVATLFNDYLWTFEKFMFNLGENATATNLFVTTNAIINYYVIIGLLHLIIDLIMFIPNVVKHAVNKITGGEKE